MTSSTRSGLGLAAGWRWVTLWLAIGWAALGQALPPAHAQGGATPGEPWLTMRVVDPTGAPVPEALVYLGGCDPDDYACQPRRTDQQGLLRVSPSALLAQPVALALREVKAAGQDGVCCQGGRQSPCSMARGSWSYRVYLTNLVWSGEGDPRSVAVQQDGTLELRLQRLHPLILFDLAVSLDWPASDEYLHTLKEALRAASDALFDLTDGQMAFGRLVVSNDSEHWDEANIRVHRQNTVCPYAPIGVLTGQASQGSIDLSPYWDGDYVSGDWSEPNGYRTIVHEFLHYALGLYDEYLDATGQAGGYCPQPQEQLCAGSDRINASAMFHEECATELSAQDVAHLWSEACKDTWQWQRTAQSAWQTVESNYGDCRQTPPRWQIDTPMRRQSAMAGPDPAAGQWPQALPRWPEVIFPRASAGASDRRVRLTAPARCAGAAASVTLYPGGARPAKALGKASLDAEFVLLGVQPGDVICAVAEGGAWEGACAATFPVTETNLGATETITLSAFACNKPAMALTMPLGGLPLAVWPAPWYVEASEQASYEPGGTNVAASGSEGLSPALPYNLARGAAGLAELLQAIRPPDATLDRWEQGQLFATDPALANFADVLGRALGDYAVGTFEPGQAGELFALDGGVSLAIDLPPARDGNATAILLQPQQTPPVPLPDNVRAQSDIAYVTGAGVSDLTEGHAVLRWNCVPRPAGFAQPAHYALLRYDDRRRQWQTQSATWIEAANILTAPISQPGHYVFVEIDDAPGGDWRSGLPAGVIGPQPSER